MAEPDQLDIKEISPGKWQLSFPYNPEFIEYLKSRVPARDRSYDPDTHFWTVNDDGHYIAALEGVGAQKFQFATKIFYRDGKQVWKNLRTGHESIQENLF